MACYHPRPVVQHKNGGKIAFLKPMTMYTNRNWKEQMTIPCRKCIGCKTDYAKEWATRCTLEAQYYEHNYFITLTYANEHLTLNEAGESTINQQDITKFIKTLRKHFERKGHTGIKYFLGAEYGKKWKTKRPHYHICFFNLPLTDLEPTGEKNDLGQEYFISKYIDKIWNKGIHKIGIVTYESAGYTARYCLKKQTKLDYKEMGIEPEKVRMSKGIGKQHLNKNLEEIIKTDKVIITNNKGTKAITPPKYYDRYIKENLPEQWEKTKEKRKTNAIIQTENELRENGYTYTQNLGNKQKQMYANLKKLKRPLKKQKE